MEVEDSPVDIEEEGSEVRPFAYIPTVNEFSEELVEAMDPENGIEEEYMPYNSSVSDLISV